MSGCDGGAARGFPAFPPRRGGGGHSWWARAWVRALEDTSLDAAQLRQGRRYAATGRVGAITVSPGRIAAPVLGVDGIPYEAVVLVERLTDEEWDRFLGEVAAKAGRIAALLDRDMPHDLVEAAQDAGVRLLPGIGGLEPECDCGGFELPCRHAAALCYQVSWLLDDEPLLLLLLRGRGERELLASLRAHHYKSGAAADAEEAAQEGGPSRTGSPSHGDEDRRSRPDKGGLERVAGVAAAQAYARGVGELPAPPPVPGDCSLLPAPAPAPGVDPRSLVRLAADAAVRARELLLRDQDSPVPELDVWQDTVRLAATHRDAERDVGLFERLRDASGRPQELARAVRAWQYAGLDGLAALEEPWSPARPDVARAQAALTAVWADAEGGAPPRLIVRRNRWTLPGRGIQLRYGRDGRWYPFREEPDGWWPAGPPERDMAAALTELLAG